MTRSTEEGERKCGQSKSKKQKLRRQRLIAENGHSQS
jgi:hypothetical protein